MTETVSLTEQVRLNADQLREFYHDEFVTDQYRDFMQLVGPPPPISGVVVDMGGGCGFFAETLMREGKWPVRVVDMDPGSVAQATARGLDAILGNALQPPFRGDETVVSFNLILHHLVADDEAGTRALQMAALAVWQSRADTVFVNEYIYESFLGNISGWLIHAVTRNKALSGMLGWCSKFVPALKANTFGVGVRFRAADEWRSLFREAGYEVINTTHGVPEHVSPLWRLLLIKKIRRDSFILKYHT